MHSCSNGQGRLRVLLLEWLLLCMHGSTGSRGHVGDALLQCRQNGRKLCALRQAARGGGGGRRRGCARGCRCCPGLVVPRRGRRQKRCLCRARRGKASPSRCRQRRRLYCLALLCNAARAPCPTRRGLEEPRTGRLHILLLQQQQVLLAAAAAQAALAAGRERGGRWRRCLRGLGAEGRRHSLPRLAERRAKEHDKHRGHTLQLLLLRRVRCGYCSCVACWQCGAN